jgi:hypothetical protein
LNGRVFDFGGSECQSSRNVRSSYSVALSLGSHQSQQINNSNVVNRGLSSYIRSQTCVLNDETTVSGKNDGIL